MSAAVSFSHVHYRIGNRQILADINLELRPGETLVILGRSGSGKTTALKLINALLVPSEGEVRVNGESTTRWDPIRLRRQIGYVIQDVGLFPHFTIARNVGLVPELEGWEPARTNGRIHELLDLVGLPHADFESRYPRQLSGGQKQRVGIARALAVDPPILLLDEPFGALDPVTRYDLQNQFLDLTRRLNKTTVFVTHDVQEAVRLATRIAVLNQGRLELLADPSVFKQQTEGEAAKFIATL
jgi:osmoprotectant transport system ATP-binding protein